MKKVKVLIVDDSALVREILSKGLAADPGIEVVGKAPDVYIARDKIIFKKPDVLTLDIEMPRMDGVEFLKRLMPQYPLPIIIVSSMSTPGAKVTIEALENGAVDFVLKPSSRVGEGLKGMIEELTEKIKAAATANVSKWHREILNKRNQTNPVKPINSSRILEDSTDKIVAIGASTGGTVAISKIISNYTFDMPGTVIVQHMPSGFTSLFANKLDYDSKVEVKEAENGDRILKGRVLIAPGGKQMEVVRSGGNYLVKCFSGNKVNGHCPSVEVLFNSIAEQVGPNAVGIMLTGMGKDGANGMLNMRNTGARTFAQNERSSVIFGMPKEAYDCGGAEELVDINDVNETIVKMLQKMK